MVRFIVVDENMLCCVSDDRPHEADILASSVLRGCVHDPLSGPIAMPRSNFRPAKRADFDDFRVLATGYENDSEHYDFPKD